MRRIIYLFAMILMMSSCSNKNKSIIENQKYDAVYGTYTGLVPCAGCPGIWFTLHLQKDRKYISSAAYQHIPDIPYIDSGKFLINGLDKLTLQKEKKGHAFFQIRNKSLEFLDAAGNTISSDYHDLYILKKVDTSSSSVEELKGVWILFEIMGRQVTRGESPALPFLNFNSEKNNVTGNAGCNEISSTFVTEGDILLFNPFVTTKMDCSDKLEAVFLESLLGPLRFHIEKGQLILRKNEEELLKFIKKE